MQVGTKKCSRPNQKIAQKSQKRRTECSQIRYLDPKTSPLHEIGASPDIRNGVYWTRFELTKGEWIPVPADVVIKDPNRNGAPVAWWYFQGGKLQIRCYAPGGGV